MKMGTKLALASAGATAILGGLLVGASFGEDRPTLLESMAVLFSLGWFVAILNYSAGEREAAERERKWLLRQQRKPPDQD